MYVYLMVEETGKSVMTSMINKLASSGTEYLDDMGYAFLQVQEYRMDTAKTWLTEHFTDNSQLICSAFRFDNAMWNSEEEKEYALLYIGAIDLEMKTYIEDFYCSDIPEGSNSKVELECTELISFFHILS